MALFLFHTFDNDHCVVELADSQVEDAERQLKLKYGESDFELRQIESVTLEDLLNIADRRG